MNFQETEEQQALRRAVADLGKRYGHDYTAPQHQQAVWVHELRLVSIVCGLATVLAACTPAPTGPSSSGSQAAGQPKKGGTLVLARAGEVTNLDPHKVPAFTSARVFELVYSYLMRLDENLGVQPDLAESMPTTSSDGKTVTVKLRSGVKFHNGDPLTSADVKYTFDRILDTRTAAVASWIPG